MALNSKLPKRKPKRKKRPRLGILAIEGDWDNKLEQDTSIEGMLKLLRDGNDIPIIHRHARSIQDVRSILKMWRRKMDRFPIVYFACHGLPGKVLLGEGEHNHVTLNQLALAIRGTKPYRRGIVVFGSCETLNVSYAEIDSFLQISNSISGVTGYEGSVDFIEACALELILLDYLSRQRKITRGSLKKVHGILMNVAKPLSRRLKRVMWV